MSNVLSAFTSLPKIRSAKVENVVVIIKPRIKKKAHRLNEEKRALNRFDLRL